MNQLADLTSDCPAGLDTAPDADLDANERAIAAFIAQGLSNAQIAQQLGMPTGTIAVAIAQSMRKLQVRTRARIAVWAVEQGLCLSRY
jgi:DNA-binding NarL/FixJ family response regulator